MVLLSCRIMYGMALVVMGRSLVSGRPQRLEDCNTPSTTTKSSTPSSKAFSIAVSSQKAGARLSSADTAVVETNNQTPGEWGAAAAPGGLSLDSTFLCDYDNMLPSSPIVKTSTGLSIDADVYLTDLVRESNETIKAYKDAGKTVICYFAAGTTDWGQANAADFDPECICGPGGTMNADKTECVNGAPNVKQKLWDMYWLDIHSDKCKTQVKVAMAKRMALGREKGCDGVDPDNVDSYIHDGPPHGNTLEDEAEYLQWMAETAHASGMFIGLKNGANMIQSSVGPGIVSTFDFSLNESCGVRSTDDYDECGIYDAFSAAGKPQLRIEYSNSITTCPVLKPGQNLAVYSGLTMNSKEITLNCASGRI